MPRPAPHPPVAALIFKAAVQLAGPSLAGTFHANELVVAAWELDKSKLGLRGYEDVHPDSNRVLCELSGAHKQTQRLIERVAPKTFRLTEAGRLAANGHANGNGKAKQHAAPKPPPVPQYVRAILERDFADQPDALAAADVLTLLVHHGRVKVKCEHGRTWDGVAPTARCRVCRYRWAWRDGGFVAERY